MYCTICKSWKQKTGKYCTHCGNDLKDDINFYGREFSKGNQEASAMHLGDISLKSGLLDSAIKEQVIQKEAIETAGSSGDGVGKAVAGKSAASMAAKVQGIKILLGVIGLSIVLGGGYAAVQFSQSRQSSEEDTSVVELVDETEELYYYKDII